MTSDTRQVIRRMLCETEHPPGGRELTDAEHALIAEFEFDTTGPSPDPQSPDVMWQAYDAMPTEQLAEYVGPHGLYTWTRWFDIQYENADYRSPERRDELDEILEGPIREPVVISEATEMDREEFKPKGDYILWDGTHRFAGSLKAEHPTIPVLLGVLP